MLTDQLLDEIEAGQGESLTIAARRIPPTRQGKPVTLSCLLRWVLSGVRGPDGQRVRLEAARLANRWVTTPGALRRFMEAQTPRFATEETPTLRSSPQRRRASEQAGAELERRGI
jgi:hypothetical protein